MKKATHCFLNVLPKNIYLQNRNRKNQVNCQFVMKGKYQNRFFETKIIEMPYEINHDYFHTFSNGRTEYILPFKKEIFCLCSIDELIENVQVKILDESIEILDKGKNKLRKKLKCDLPVYKKKKDVLKLPDPTMGFGMGIFPFYRITDQYELNRYSVLLVDFGEFDVKLSFYRIENNELVKLHAIEKIRQPKTEDMAGSIYYELCFNENNAFDFIEVNLGGKQKGLVIPKFRKIEYKGCWEEYNFSIDTNNCTTHIVYNTQTEPTIKSLDIGKKDIQMIMLNSRGKDTSGAQNLGESFNYYGFGQFYQMIAIKIREFMPSIIGEDSSISFPVNTVVAESKNAMKNPIILFGSMNIGFYHPFEEKTLDHIRYVAKLFKEQPLAEIEQKRIFLYFVQLFWMIKNKIVLNQGNISKSKIAWNQPDIKNNRALEKYKQIVQFAFAEVFTEDACKLFIYDGRPNRYQYARSFFSFYPSVDALTIDVGFRKSNVVFCNGSPNGILYSSLQFGSDDLWGDGVQSVSKRKFPKDNGFFLLMKSKIDKEEIKLDGRIKNYYQTFYKNPTFNSADMTSFLFKYDNIFKFSKYLSETRFIPSLFILHYSSVIYYISRQLTKNNLRTPAYIVISGFGCEYLKILFPDAMDMNTRETSISQYTNLLFTKFTKNETPDIFQVCCLSNPQEAIAIGGMNRLINENYHNMDIEKKSQCIEPKDDISNVFSACIQMRKTGLKKTRESALSEIYDLVNMLTEDCDLLEFFHCNNITMQYGKTDVKHLVMKYAPSSFDKILTHFQKDQGYENSLLKESVLFWGLKDVFYKISKELFVLENKNYK